MRNPPGSEVVKTTTIREVVPENLKLPAPDYWEFVRTIKPDSAEYIIYLYRDSPNRIQIDHTTGPFWEVPDYGSVSIADQESLETAISRDCGGGTYKVILKTRSTGAWICSANFRIDLAPRPIMPWFQRRLPNTPGTIPTNSPTGTMGPPVLPGDGTTQIASKAIDTIANQEHTAVNIGLGAMRTTADLMNTMAARMLQPPAPAPTDDITKQLLTAALAKMLNPPDPFELVKQVMGLQSTMAAPTNPLEQFRNVYALVREISGSVAPASSTGAAVVQSIPTIAGHVVEGLREWRLGMEAQRDGVAMMQHPGARRPPQSVTPAQIMPPAPRIPPPSVNPEINPATAMPPQAIQQASPGIVPPSTEFVETRIIQTFRQPIPADEAANRTIEFLYMLSGETPDQNYVEVLARQGEAGLIALFGIRPILQPATQDPQRLQEFVRAFLKEYEEEKAEEARELAAKPN